MAVVPVGFYAFSRQLFTTPVTVTESSELVKQVGSATVDYVPQAGDVLLVVASSLKAVSCSLTGPGVEELEVEPQVGYSLAWRVWKVVLADETFSVTFQTSGVHGDQYPWPGFALAAFRNGSGAVEVGVPMERSGLAPTAIPVDGLGGDVTASVTGTPGANVGLQTRVRDATGSGGLDVSWFSGQFQFATSGGFVAKPAGQLVVGAYAATGGLISGLGEPWATEGGGLFTDNYRSLFFHAALRPLDPSVLPEYVGTSNEGGEHPNSQTEFVEWPAGTQAGDVAIVAYEQGDWSSLLAGGWTMLDSLDAAGELSPYNGIAVPSVMDVPTAWFWKTLDAPAVAAGGFSWWRQHYWSGVTANVYRGVDPTDPVLAWSWTYNFNGQGYKYFPAIDVAGTNVVHVAFVTIGTSSGPTGGDPLMRWPSGALWTRRAYNRPTWDYGVAAWDNLAIPGSGPLSHGEIVYYDDPAAAVAGTTWGVGTVQRSGRETRRA